MECGQPHSIWTWEMCLSWHFMHGQHVTTPSQVFKENDILKLSFIMEYSTIIYDITTESWFLQAICGQLLHRCEQREWACHTLLDCGIPWHVKLYYSAPNRITYYNTLYQRHFTIMLHGTIHNRTYKSKAATIWNPLGIHCWNMEAYALPQQGLICMLVGSLQNMSHCTYHRIYNMNDFVYVMCCP